MLERQLETYSHMGVYPFHMPGHKRMEMGMKNPYEIDVTEIDGFDNLHHPHGVIAEDMKELAGLYHSAYSYFLVNGSTAGNLAAIYAALPDGGNILMGRNSHISAYHGAMLRHLIVSYLYPKIEAIHGIAGMISSAQVEKKLNQYKDAQAIFLTSPTYEGVVSELSEIVSLAHGRGIPVIVDAAHGAHLGFNSYFPPSPIESGADIVIMSMHKTLPALTQTAVLHLNGDLIDRERLEEALRIFQTTSPSYVLMSSISRCVNFLKDRGKEAFGAYSQRLKRFYDLNEGLRHLKVLQLPHQDPSKLVISTAAAGISGEMLARQLREEFSLEMEMASRNYVIAMTSVVDTDAGFHRLTQALSETDQKISPREDRTVFSNPFPFEGLWQMEEKIMESWQTIAFSSQWVSMESCVGRIAAADIMLYPPGIPVLMAGERIFREKLDLLRKAKELGLTVYGWKTDWNHDNIYIRCVEDK